MKLKNIIFLFVALFMLISKTNAQYNHNLNNNSKNEHPIQTSILDELILNRAKQIPGFIDKYIAYENKQKQLMLFLTDNKSLLKNTKGTDTLIGGKRIVPVIFHVIHKYGVENISHEQIEDAIKLMNLDYNKENPDTTNTFPLFKSRAADPQIEFRLAKIDPWGNCTDGVDRVYDPRTDYAYFNVMRDNSWPYSKYMNVYAVSFIYPEGIILPAGALIGGLSPLTPDNTLSPSSGDTLLDGVLVRHDCVGSIGTATNMAGSGINEHNRVMTHETGHFFNLYHTFQNILATLAGIDNCTQIPLIGMNGDEVDDTPPIKAATQGCPTPGSVNTCTTSVTGYGDEPDMIENYMDYANGVCQNIFTTGQLARINTTLMNTRRNLWSYENLVATGVLDTLPSICAPIADFKSDKYLICEGVSVTFTDFSYNGLATGWEWTFPGGTPATSTDQNPVVNYPAAGIYNVTLKASNANGDNTVTKTNYLHVGGGTGLVAAPFTESFEQATVLDTWITENSTPGVNKWERTTLAAYTGSASLKLKNNQTTVESVDAIITPAYDLTNIPNPRVKFKLAFKGVTISNPLAGTSTNTFGRLRVLVSSNCGQSWLPRKSILDSALTTAGVGDTSAFVPTSQSQWREETVAALSSVAGNDNVMFKFEFTNGGGNNFYIDDINVYNDNVGIDDVNENLKLNIYPNPVNENTVISFSLITQTDIKISLFDVLGRDVETVYQGSLAEGDHNINFNKRMIKSGIYFIHFNFNNNTVVKPIVIY